LHQDLAFPLRGMIFRQIERLQDYRKEAFEHLNI
jgi:hypothetical protein